MQALFILPLLMSALAMAISLLAGVAPVAIAAVDLAMFSPAQAIIAADAGENAVDGEQGCNEELFRRKPSSRDETSIMPANGTRILHQRGFGRATIPRDRLAPLKW